MPIESSVTVISDLNVAYPDDNDSKAIGANHLRNVKVALKSLNTASATKGAAQVGFLPSGTGASTSLTSQDKLREFSSPQDSGALGDNTTDDTTNFQNSLTQKLAVRLPKASGYKVTTLSLPASSRLSGERRQSPVTVNGTGGLAVAGSNVSVRDLYVTAPGSAQIVYASASASDVDLVGLDLSSDATASPDGQGVQVNQAASHRWRLMGSRLSVYNYPYLLNSTAGGSKGHAVVANHLTAQVGDAVEFNTPGTAAEDIIVAYNILNVTAGSGTAKGFGAGFAHVNGAAVIGNITQRSWLAAVHIEDGSKNVTVVGHIAKGCLDNGLEVLIGGAGSNQAQAKAVSVAASHFEADSIVAGKAGIKVVNDASGTVYGSTLAANVLRNFESGLWLGGDATHYADGNTIDSCTYALRVETGSAIYTRVAGTNLVIGTAATALLYVSSAVGAMVQAGKFVCQNKPTNIILKAGATTPRSSVAGFSWSDAGSLSAGTTWVNLFPAAATNHFKGRINIQSRDVSTLANNTSASADVVWTGAALTVSNWDVEDVGALSSSAAGTSSSALRVSGGYLQYGWGTAGSMTTRFDLDFDGVYKA